MKKAFPFFLCFLFFMCGCTTYHVDSVDTAVDFYPPKDSEDSVVYLKNVDRPFEVIGEISVVTEQVSSPEDVFVKMRREAAILGGDAFTDIRKDGKEWRPDEHVRGISQGRILARYSAKVIVLR